MKKIKFSKVVCSFLAATLVTVPNIPFNVFSQPIYAQSEENVNLEDIKAKEGLIIQMHSWSFNNIRSILPQLAEAGFKTIQVSPVQANQSGNEWWVLYQPLNQAVGNALGSRDEFKALCQEAESYGIDVIVDAVLNHVANDGAGRVDQYSNNVWSEFKNYDYYHHQGQCSDWKSREAVTQQGIGMPDLNTQNPQVQQMAINFLNDCIECGADGFRFDAAKHIETNLGEDQGKGWSGNYWNNVLGSLQNKEDLFIYGEVLDEYGSESDNLYAYDRFMTITDHYYGDTLRQAVMSYNLPAAQNWNLKLQSNNRVSYVENHDHFEHNQSTNLSDTQRKLAWGLLAARDDVTPMYLSRRTGSLGSKGSTDFMNQEIIAINWFHNAMVGESEYLRYANGNSCALVDRGTKGTAIINTGGDFYLDSETNLADGQYTDKGGSGASFTVSNGRITGNVPNSRIVVLYGAQKGDDKTTTVKVEPEKIVAGKEVTITYDATNRNLQNSGNITLHYGYDGFKGTKDANMQFVEGNKWTTTITVPDLAKSTLDCCFTNGVNWDNNGAADWHFDVIESDVEDPITSATAYFVKPNDWGTDIKIYVYDDTQGGTKELKQWPGECMSYVEGNTYKYTLPEGWEHAKVIFSDGNHQTPGSGQAGLEIGVTDMIYNNGSWSNYAG